jgi:hypothetical protein
MYLPVGRPRQIARRGMGVDRKFKHARFNGCHLASESKVL